MKGYYTIRDMAEIFECCERSIDNHVKAGLIPKPIQAGPGGKRWWKRKQVDEIVKGEAA